MKSIVVVDESPSIRETLAIVLGREHQVVTTSTIEAMPVAEAPALVILGLPPAARESAMLEAAFAAIDERVPLLLLNRPGMAAEARVRRSGRAVSCVPKPFELHVLRAAVNAAVADPERTAREPTPAHHPRYLEHPYVGRDAAAVAARAVETDLPVLIVGENGTGVVDVARALHVAGSRSAGPFVVRAASALDERELGRACREAEGGTLLLRDLEAAERDVQHALLAAMRDGSRATNGFAARVIATATAQLDEHVASGAFLPELAYLIETITLRLAPLRDRVVDVPILVEHETARLAHDLGLGTVEYTPAALSRLARYLWFGNVAELEAVLARTLALHRSARIDADDLLFHSADAPRAAVADAHAPLDRALPRATDARPLRATTAHPDRSRDAMPSADARSAEDAAPSPAKVVGAAPERRARTLHALPTASTAPGASDAGRAAFGDLPSLEVLVGELAHELRNPMVTIKTFAQHLDALLTDPDARARFAALTTEAIGRMDGLLETLLDFARFRAPQVHTTDLSRLLDRALEERRDELDRKDVRIAREGVAPIPIDADEAQVSFALRVSSRRADPGSAAARAARRAGVRSAGARADGACRADDIGAARTAGRGRRRSRPSRGVAARVHAGGGVDPPQRRHAADRRRRRRAHHDHDRVAGTSTVRETGWRWRSGRS